MKVKFVIDKEYDKATAKHLLFNKWYTQEEVDFLDDTYKKSEQVLKISQKLYQKSWNEINEEFSKYVEKITGHKWAYPEYNCVLSVINAGTTNWGVSNKVMNWWKDNPYFMRRSVAHELLISHFFDIYNKRYLKEKLSLEQLRALNQKNKRYGEENMSPNQLWALAEIAACALTSLTPEVKKWWPWESQYDFGGYGLVEVRYPKMVKLRAELKQPFLKRKSFDDYMKKGFKLVRKYPDLV